MKDSDITCEYGNIPDNILLQMANEGQEKAFTELAKRYTQKVKHLAGSYHAESLTADDWLQEGMIGFLYAVASYCEKDGAAFSTYANVCIRNRLNSTWKKANSNKNAPLNSAVEFTEDSVPNVLSPEDEYINHEQYRQFADIFREKLSETEKKVLVCTLSGYSYRETARRLGLNEKSVDNALCRAKSKLKKSIP